MYEDLLGKKKKPGTGVAKRSGLDEFIEVEVKHFSIETAKLKKRFGKMIFKILNPRSGLTEQEAELRSKKVLDEMDKYKEK